MAPHSEHGDDRFLGEFATDCVRMACSRWTISTADMTLLNENDGTNTVVSTNRAAFVSQEEDLPRQSQRSALVPALIVTAIILGIIGATVWFLMTPQPLIIQGQADATRIDIAAASTDALASGRSHAATMSSRVSFCFASIIPNS